MANSSHPLAENTLVIAHVFLANVIYSFTMTLIQLEREGVPDSRCMQCP